MSVTVKHHPKELVLKCHALADETRLRIVELLMEGERCVCDLMEELQAAQSRLSFHLRTLKDAGLVKDRRDGRWNYYSLYAEAFEDLEALVQQVKSGDRLKPATGWRCL
ncbi:MAG TPA: metalloregulator ArsR/SmtB family transcription factor [Nitrospiraceae bacterium]|nr:metalloregulator ArsR/SmtB family transcription factor [Nitrospiraceae bacterium]